MSDKIVIPCSECGSNMSVPGTAAGKKVRCSKCKAVVSIPGNSATVQRELRQAAVPSESEPRRARSAEEPARPARRRPKEPVSPVDDEWLDGNTSSYDEPGREWDSYGTAEQLPQALPPRTKRKNVGIAAPVLRGSGNEAPPPYERPREAMNSASFGSIITGILMMVGAAVWFFVGLAAGIIFFYPPILFILGFIALIKGVLRSD